MRPVIGIIGRPNFPDENDSNMVVKEFYRKKIIEFGGVPFLLLPPKLIDYNNSKPSENDILTTDDEEILLSQLKMCDGILIPGGYKVFSHEFFILRYAIDNDIPVFGICLGMQIMSNLEQEYYNEKINLEEKNHFEPSKKYSHYVNIDKNSKLYDIIHEDRIIVNSMHSYCAVKGGLYKVVAKSDDNIIEAVEYPNNRFNIGVQWHPERLDDTSSNNLWAAFINSCKK